MALELFYHPLASFCWKVLIALYENGTPFEPRFVDLGDAEASAEFRALWPMAKMPALRDGDRVVPETSIIIEYLDRRYPGPAPLIPADPDRALDVRRADRFYDLYVQQPMQKIVADRIRPDGCGDPHGVEQARATLATAYAMLDRDMAERAWAAGDAFSMADCAAAPALFYADRVAALGEHRHLARYYDRLLARPSFAQVVEEAEPYMAMFPAER